MCVCDNTLPAYSSTISLSINGGGAGDPFKVLMYTENGLATELLAEYDYNSPFVEDEWNHVLVTWDGAIVRAYLNGDILVPDSSVTNPGQQNDHPRFVALGAGLLSGSPDDFLNGLLGHTGVWSVELSADEAEQIYGNGFSIDLRYNLNDYQSAEYLKGYWKFEDPTQRGRDFTGTLDGTGNPATVETGTVIVVGESPGV
jgi:hypothetical protein